MSSLHHQWSGNAAGPVLVLSHSLGTGSEVMWARQLEELEPRFHLLRFDHRGHGLSSCPSDSGDWTIDDFGHDLVELLDRFKLSQPFFFVGVSLGGMVGQWLALHHPERLHKLVLANTTAFTEDSGLLRERMKLIEEKGLEAIAQQVLDRWFTPRFQSDNSDFVEMFRKTLLSTPAESYLKTSSAVCTCDLRDGMKEVKVPTLVIGGSEDRATPSSWGQAIARSIPGATWKELNAAHLANFEAAPEFNALILEFFLKS